MANHKQIKNFNPFDHPICFSTPRRMTLGTTAWHQHIPFAMALVDLAKPRILVELGTHYGDSYCAFCQAVDELKIATSCYAVDTWAGDLQSGPYGPEVLEDLKSHHDPLYSSFSRLIQSTFDEAVGHFNDASIGILHIDGYHTYDSVKHDFETWRPKMKANGIVLLHDTNVRERDFGIRRFWEEIQVKGPHFEFLNSHGLGILALGENYPRALRFLFEANESATIKIREFFFFVANLEGLSDTLQIKGQQLQNRDIHIGNLDRLIQDREQRLSNKDIEIETLVQKVNERWLDIGAIGQQLQYKESEIISLNKTIEIRDQSLVNKDVEIQTLVQKTHELSNIIAERDKLIQQIMSGIIMRLMTRYKLAVEKVLHPETKLRRYYDFASAGLKTIATEGPGSFWRKFRHYRSLRKKNSRIKIKPLKLKPLIEDPQKSVAAIDKTVSIVIPTKNAGIDFDFTLGKIRNQKGIREIEIIVVDSGSTDNTIEVAIKYAAMVHSIDPSDFNHGLTRNYGAGQSHGEYVLFMVQDAMPIGDYWLHDMLHVLEGDNKIAAVTCRQVPRSDADLFACASLCNHNRALIFSRDGVASTSAKFDDLSPIDKRRLAGLDNVCSMIRKDVFDKFKFTNIRYGEDLELGLKIRAAGYSWAFLYWTAVIHSHNRSADYLLKRGYVDAKLLAEILSYEPPDQYVDYLDVMDVVGCLRILYAAINLSVVALGTYDDNVKDTLQRFKSFVQANLNSGPTRLKNFERSGRYLDGIFDDMIKLTGTGDLKPNDSLTQSYFDSIDHFAGYVRAYKSVKEKEGQFVDALYKIFAIIAGHALADYYLLMSRGGGVNESLTYINSLLSEGV